VACEYKVIVTALKLKLIKTYGWFNIALFSLNFIKFSKGVSKMNFGQKYVS